MWSRWTLGRVFSTCALALTLGATACNVFDPSLYQDLVSGPDGGRELKAIADRCERDVPLIQSSEASFLIDTSSLTGDYRDFGDCVGRELRGNEGFVQVQMIAGEKWHVHVDPQSADLDPAIYLLPSCDARSCRPRAAYDQCGPGQAEHLSYVAETSGPHLIGFDSGQTGGGLFSVIVTRPRCGNGGLPEHSEACDDGNNRAGDGCDACRFELEGPSTREREPNEHPLEANVLASRSPFGPPTEISGGLGNRCGDTDVFALEVPPGGQIRTQLSGRGGACTVPPGVQLTLLGPDGVRELGFARAAGEAPGCLGFDETHPFARALDPGTYYLRVSGAPTEPFAYQLKVE